MMKKIWTLFALLPLIFGVAHAQVKISALPSASAQTGTEVLPEYQAGQCPSTSGTCGVTVNQLKTFTNTAIPLSGLAAIAGGTILGNSTGSSAAPAALTSLPAAIAVSASQIAAIPGNTVLCNSSGSSASPGACTTLPAAFQFWPQTTAEATHSITPVNYFYPAGTLDRYVTNATPGTTDMTVAMQDALLVSAVVYARAETYAFDTTSGFTVDSERIQGAGEPATVFTFPDLTGYALTLQGSSATAPGLSGFQLIGNSGASGGIAFNPASGGTGVSYALLQDINVTGFTKTGAVACYVNGYLNAGVFYNTFINVACGGSASGPGANYIGAEFVSTDGAANGNRVNGNTMIGGSATFNTSDGIVVNYASGNSFVGVDREENGGSGMNVENNAFGTTISGGYSEGNAFSVTKLVTSVVQLTGGNVVDSPSATGWTYQDTYMPGGQVHAVDGIAPDGGVQIGTTAGAPAGGDKGPGTVNVSTGIYSPAFSLANPGVFTNTQMNDPATSLINGLSPFLEYQRAQGNEYTTDALIGGTLVPSGATVFQANGVSGYVKNTSATTAGVGIYGQGRCVSSSNGARCWGSNLVSTDVTDAGTSPTVTSTLYGLETDVDPMNSGDGDDGQLSLLNSSLLSNLVGGAAFLAGGNTRSSGNLWGFGFETQDAGAIAAFAAGASCLTGSCASQTMRFYYGGGVGTYTSINADSNGNLVVPLMKLAVYTVSTLPTCNSSTKEDMASVTDATSPTYNGALTGGGSVVVPVFCNGSAWTSH